MQRQGAEPAPFAQALICTAALLSLVCVNSGLKAAGA